MEAKKPIVVCITGGAGQIGYSLLPMIASGAVFGLDQPVELRIHGIFYFHDEPIDIPAKTEHMRGVAMELDDCKFPLLTCVKFSTTLEKSMKAIDWCVMLASMPLLPGEERRDLIKKNVTLLTNFGKAMNEVSKPTSKSFFF